MKFRLSSEFGELSPVRDMIPHTGIDLAIPQNTVLRAISDGVVDKVFNGTGNIGKGLSIQLEDGSRMIYGHLNNVAVKVGEKIQEGEVIGLSGSSGNSTAPHLHFAIRNQDGSWIDPTPLAEKVGEYAGQKGMLSYIGGWFNDKVAEITINRFTDFVESFIMALPIFLVVGASVFFLLNMVNKSLAKWGTIGVFIYGGYWLVVA